MSHWTSKPRWSMRHKEIRTIDLRVGVWRHTALKCGRFFLWVGKTSEKGSLPVHISSAGLFLLAHLPIQARSASDQRLQTTNTKTISTSCQNSLPLTTRQQNDKSSWLHHKIKGRNLKRIFQKEDSYFYPGFVFHQTTTLWTKFWQK